MKITVLALALVALLAPSFELSAQTMPKDADPATWARAMKIHKKAIVVDGHNDITSPMVDEDFDLRTNSVGKFHLGGDPFHTDIGHPRRRRANFQCLDQRHDLLLGSFGFQFDSPIVTVSHAADQPALARDAYGERTITDALDSS